MTFQLIEDWKKKAPRLWSVRLSIVAALASGVEAGISLALDQRPWAAIVAGLVSVGAAISRLIAQPKLTADIAHEKFVDSLTTEYGHDEQPK